MVSFTLTTGIALLASVASVAAFPSPFNMGSALEARQQLPPDCTDYCSVSAGCVCIRRPTNCVANYTVDSGENCGTVVSRFNNFTATDLYKWNPEIGQTCIGLRAYVPVCIGVPGYVYPGAVKGGDTATPSQTPVPIQYEIVSTCQKYEYTDSKGVPSFATLLSSNGITQKQWNQWNYPSKNDTDNLAVFAGYWSCVKA